MRKFVIDQDERGLLFQGREFKVMLSPGRHWFFDPRNEIVVETVSTKVPRFKHRDLESIAKSGALGGEALIVELSQTQRALVWVDEKIEAFLEPGTHAFWTENRHIRVQVFDNCELSAEQFQRSRRVKRLARSQ